MCENLILRPVSFTPRLTSRPLYNNRLASAPEANAEVEAVHPKAMPIILTEPSEIERWMFATWEDARGLQRPLADGALRILARGVKRMMPEQERQLAVKLSRDALHLHERSRKAGWIGASIWLRFRAILAEETAARLRRRSD